MKSVQFITIDEQCLNQRIDNFLHSQLKKVPKSHLYKIIRKGEVRVNKKRIKPVYKLQIGDVVRIPPVALASSVSAKKNGQLLEILKQNILYEDSCMMVLNKPAGLAVHGGSGINLGVIETLRSMMDDKMYLELVHRLDKDTSGCLMLARKRSMLRHLQNEIRHRRVKKIYHAVVFGSLHKTIRCNASLLKINHANGDRMVQVNVGGKSSLSTFRPIKVLKNGHTLVEVDIKTGRTHQIRAHARHIGHPVLGDNKYANQFSQSESRRLALRRMCLHAQSLSFVLPGGELFHMACDADFGITLG